MIAKQIPIRVRGAPYEGVFSDGQSGRAEITHHDIDRLAACIINDDGNEYKNLGLDFKKVFKRSTAPVPSFKIV